MTVTTESGRRLTIPAHHPVFCPVGNYSPGDEIDPQTVDVNTDRAALLVKGNRFIVDNRVEVVAAVITA